MVYSNIYTKFSGPKPYNYRVMRAHTDKNGNIDAFSDSLDEYINFKKSTPIT